MKYIRLFPSASIRDAVLAEIKHSVLSYTEGEGVLLKAVAAPPTPAPPSPDPTVPFYIEDISGSENTVQIKKNDDGAPAITIYKSLDGITWTSMGTTTTTAITATIPANGKLYLQCTTNNWGKSISYNTINTTGNCNVGGNSMSLLWGQNWKNKTTFPSATVQYILAHIFRGNTHIINASGLVLPATILYNFSYAQMFNGCTSLITAPELPAITFSGTSCYVQMFNGCTSLTTAPELPATTLTQGCYAQMFNGCTSLTTAPELPATTLTQGCYYRMFYNCTNLNHIKCLATDISVNNCTKEWLNSVAATGTFIKDPSMSNWSSGDAGIPSGWTVQDAA